MINSFWERVIVVDVETGGLDPAVNAVLTVALVASHGRKIQVKVRDSGECTTRALEVNRIDLYDHMRTALEPAAAVDALEAFLATIQTGPHAPPPNAKFWLAGHNIAFDLGFIARLYGLAGRTPPRIFSTHRTLDTHTILWERFARGEISEESTSTDVAFPKYGISIPDEDRHTALGDAVATRKLLGFLIASCEEPEIDVQDVARIAGALEVIFDLVDAPTVHRTVLRKAVRDALRERNLPHVHYHFATRMGASHWAVTLSAVQIAKARTYLESITT